MREVDPKETSRAMSYEMYIDAPMPMVTLFKTLDITPLVRLARKGHKLNMLLCWCAAAAAQRVREFYLLPVGKAMVEYDSVAVNVIVKDDRGELVSCDIPYSPALSDFERDYLAITAHAKATGAGCELPDSMILGTSSLAKHDIDGAVNFYSGIFNNPFLIWGKYIRRGLKKVLKVSFQFHHVQMDGEEACRFLEYMQEEIQTLRNKGSFAAHKEKSE